MSERKYIYYSMPLVICLVVISHYNEFIIMKSVRERAHEINIEMVAFVTRLAETTSVDTSTGVGYDRSFCYSFKTDDRITVNKLNELQANPATELGGTFGSVDVQTLEDVSKEQETEHCIPKRMHFLWFGNEIPEKYIKNIMSFRRNNPYYEINLWTEKISDELKKKSSGIFIVGNLTREVEQFTTKDLIFEESNMGAKSDIARYEIVYRHGGMYLDTDSISLKPFYQTLMHSFVAYVDNGFRNIQNSIFGFPKGSRLLDYTLRMLRKHIKKNPDMYVPYKTGPAFFTGAFLKYADNEVNMIHQKYLCLQNETISLSMQSYDATWTKQK